MVRRMSTAKSKATAAKASTERSLYATTGDDARREAQRKLLLSTLRKTRWSLRAAADALGLSGSAGVVRALKDVAPEEYAAARADGRIKAGAPRA